MDMTTMSRWFQRLVSRDREKQTGECLNCGFPIPPYYDLCSGKCETELKLKRLREKLLAANDGTQPRGMANQTPARKAEK